MSKTHYLKCWPQYFEAVNSGAKPFELRQNDRDYQVGDTLVLQEYEPDTSAYTGYELRALVTYVLEGEPWLQPGYAALGLNVQAASGAKVQPPHYEWRREP